MNLSYYPHIMLLRTYSIVSKGSTTDRVCRQQGFVGNERKKIKLQHFMVVIRKLKKIVINTEGFKRNFFASLMLRISATRQYPYFISNIHVTDGQLDFTSCQSYFLSRTSSKVDLDNNCGSCDC